MEKLEFEFRGHGASLAEPRPVLVGVVASGNLEVLMEPASLQGGCRVVVNTAARGFGNIWQAVLEDFINRHEVADLSIAINDAGATPAVVSLRLDQALEEYQGAAS
ncbi:MAG: malonate decarboxylase acyl carrier protein [Candidatus Competibacteraceae bacterium]|nr:malonate decarboxylase acyl carrier protein [Candidatus Competibacteraceae bacterium]